MEPLALLLNFGPHEGHFFFPFFHPGFFWVGLLILFLVLKRGGHHRYHGHHQRSRPTPTPRPPAPSAGKGDSGPAWPDLYPEDPSNPSQPPLEPKGKVEYF
jgi:hypothetical protein